MIFGSKSNINCFGGSMCSVWVAVGFRCCDDAVAIREFFWNTLMLRLTFPSEVRCCFHIVWLGFFPVISQVWRLNFIKGHSLWYLVPLLKAEVCTWIVCPHSQPPVVQIYLNVFIAPLLNSFSHFPRPSLFAFQVCRGTRVKGRRPGISEGPGNSRGVRQAWSSLP